MNARSTIAVAIVCGFLSGFVGSLIAQPSGTTVFPGDISIGGQVTSLLDVEQGANALGNGVRIGDNGSADYWEFFSDGTDLVLNSNTNDRFDFVRTGHLELVGEVRPDAAAAGTATIAAAGSTTHDLALSANGDVVIRLDEDNDSAETLRVIEGSNTEVAVLDESGHLGLDGNLTLRDDGGGNGQIITSNSTAQDIDLRPYGSLNVYLDDDNNTAEVFEIFDGGDNSVFAVEEGGDITSSSVGTAALKTSTSSTASSVAADVTMNDYSFFPKIENDDCSMTGGQPDLEIGAAAADDTVGFFHMAHTCGMGDWDVRWRYITASDRARMWIIYTNATGEVMAVWESDDPPRQDLGDADTTAGLIVRDNPDTPIDETTVYTATRVDIPPLSRISALYAVMPPAERTTARAQLKTKLEDRGWATDADDETALNQVPARYQDSARLASLRLVAEQVGVSPASLLRALSRYDTVRGELVWVTDLNMALTLYRSSRVAQ